MDKIIPKPIPRQGKEIRLSIPGRSETPEVPVGTGRYPCLINNYSIQSTPKSDEKPNTAKSRRQYLAQKRYEKNKKSWARVTPKLESRHFKGMSRMQKVIETAVDKWGWECTGILHLTFGRNVSWAEAQKSFNSLNNVLRDRYGVDIHRRYRSGPNKGSLMYDEQGKALMGKDSRIIAVCERGENNGRVHFHVVFQKTGADFRTGTRFGFYKGKRTIHPNPDCKTEFKFWRECLAKYGFGPRVRIEPLKSVQGGARYLSKYVGKGYFSRSKTMFGKQLVRYGSAYAKLHSAQFSYANGAAADRRWIMEQLASMYNLYDDPEVGATFSEKFGRQWAYFTMDAFLAIGACDPYCLSTCGSHARERVTKWVWDKFMIKLKWHNMKGFAGAHYMINSSPKFMYKQSWIKEKDQRKKYQTPEEDRIYEKCLLDPFEITQKLWDELHIQLANLWDQDGEGEEPEPVDYKRSPRKAQPSSDVPF